MTAGVSLVEEKNPSHGWLAGNNNETKTVFEKNESAYIYFWLGCRVVEGKNEKNFHRLQTQAHGRGEGKKTKEKQQQRKTFELYTNSLAKREMTSRKTKVEPKAEWKKFNRRANTFN